MIATSKFNKDLQAGKQGEQAVHQLFQSLGYSVTDISDDKSADLRATTNTDSFDIEVKTTWPMYVFDAWRAEVHSSASGKNLYSNTGNSVYLSSYLRQSNTEYVVSVDLPANAKGVPALKTMRDRPINRPSHRAYVYCYKTLWMHLMDKLDTTPLEEWNNRGPHSKPSYGYSIPWEDKSAGWLATYDTTCNKLINGSLSAN